MGLSGVVPSEEVRPELGLEGSWGPGSRHLGKGFIRQDQGAPLALSSSAGRGGWGTARRNFMPLMVEGEDSKEKPETRTGTWLLAEGRRNG